MKELIYTSTPVHQYTSKKFCEFFTLIILTFMLIGTAKAQNCKPILSGKHSICSPPQSNLFQYKIDNFTNGATYWATVTTYQGSTQTTNGFSVTSNVFTAFTYNSSITAARIIIQQTSPCNDADTIYVEPCCSVDPGTQIVDINPNQIPNIVFTGSTYIYDPVAYPNQPPTIEIHGQLTINSTLEIYNTTINVDQGGTIKVESGKAFGAINTIIRAGCGNLWQGIHAENQSEVKLRNGSIIRDAEYGLSINGIVSGDFNNTTAQPTRFLNNFISVYSHDNSSGNSLNFSGAPGPGILIDQNANLLPPYFGQKTNPSARSYAGFFLKDNANFNNIIGNSSMNISINNMNIGIAAIRGSINLLKNVDIINTTVDPFYTYSNRYNGTAVYCEGTNSTPQTINFGSLTNSSSSVNNIDNCRFGVFAFKNVNVNCLNNNFDNITNIGGVKVDNVNCIGNSTIIKNNRFDTRFYCAIFCSRFNSAHLEIDNNTFNTGLYYPVNSTPGPNLTNVAIRLAFLNPTTLTGHISNNTFNWARIGIFATNIRGEGSAINHMFSIDNNILNFNRSITNYFDPLFKPYIHSGIWLQNSNNVHISDNNITRNAGLAGAPSGFESFLTGLKIDDCNGQATLVENNTLTHMGTGIFVNKNCTGANIYCNTMVGDVAAGTPTFPRGIHFQNATLGDQGSTSSPYNNIFSSFANNTRKFSGTMSTAMRWFYSTNFSITPFSVNPINNFTPQIANVPLSSSCGVSNPSLTDAVYERVRQIIYNEIQYDTDVEENIYLDKVFAYNAIKNDSILESIDQSYSNFIFEHSQDNIGQYVDAIALSNESQVQQALSILSNLISTNLIEENKIAVDRIALTLELENRELNDSDWQVLSPIINSNALIGGEGVINSRSLTNIEIYEEPSYMRIHSTTYLNSPSKPITLEQIHHLSLQQKEKINVQVYNVVGQLEYTGTLKSWEVNSKSHSNEFCIIKYYNLSEYLGCEKTLKLN